MMLITKKIICIFLIALFCNQIVALKHHLVLSNDHRSYFSVSSFGFLYGGRLDVIVQNLTLNPDPSEDREVPPQFGFILYKLDGMKNPIQLNNIDRDEDCMLNIPGSFYTYDLITMAMDPMSKNVALKCAGDMLPGLSSLSYDSRRDGERSHASFIHDHIKRAAGTNSDVAAKDYLETRFGRKKRIMGKCPRSPESLPLLVSTNENGRSSYAFNFTMFIGNKQEEGFYYLTFHNCRGLRDPLEMHSQRMYATTRFNLSMLIYETNYPEIYLSAGSMALPQMYFILSVMFFLTGCVWINYISRQKENTLKIHRLMSILVFAKAASLLFHGINYHYIAIDGQPVVTWAYLYYATRSVKGALFFLTLVLIGSGWSFVKHILSDKDKKIIIVVCCLQVIAHIAEIVLDESTEGEASNEFWSQLCSIVDLFSCVMILVPISWSVKHLEDASRTDGKAAINLKKLELFKRFYIISTIYVYITRIIKFLFLSALSYKYSWVAELVSELVTLIYYIVTGCYFQPMPTNPYLLLSSDNDMEEDILFSVDAHDMNGINSSRMDEVSVSIEDQDRNTLLDESKQKVTRRLVEDTV